jgi:hydrogenase nickel incorporation protein HypB
LAIGIEFMGPNVRRQTTEVKRDIRAEQRMAAERFRAQLTRSGTLAVRLLSSPGAGKTTLLEETIQRLGVRHAVGVLVGDVETERDAERLRRYAPSVQITTGGACHLELPLVEDALPALGEQPLDFLFIEDVGNLICPASHDLGEHLRVIVLSTTEGDDKPGKYPKAFRTSQVVLISKLDLLPYVPFVVASAEADARLVQPALTVLPVCAVTGEGLDAWCALLHQKRQQLLAGLPRGMH